jgi:ABC-type lipoprotein export system ATPase subunit
MISLKNVTRKYSLDENTFIEPVKDVSLEVSKGEFIIMIGRSGSGKTTLLNLIAGLIKPTSGEVSIGGTNLQKMSDRQLSSLRSNKIGFVFQFPSLLPALNVLDNVVFPSTFVSKNGKLDARERAIKLLGTVGIGNKLEAMPAHLSAGEQKRAVLARALINEPEILLCDEPTSDLDEKTEHEIMDMLLKIRSSGVTIVMITHSLQLVPYANRAYTMINGKLSEIPITGVPDAFKIFSIPLEA